MQGFYCNDVHWLVTVDGLTSGLFMLGADAKKFYAEKVASEDQESEVALWRLSSGYLCTPAVEKRKSWQWRITQQSAAPARRPLDCRVSPGVTTENECKN